MAHRHREVVSFRHFTVLLNWVLLERCSRLQCRLSESTSTSSSIRPNVNTAALRALGGVVGAEEKNAECSTGRELASSKQGQSRFASSKSLGLGAEQEDKKKRSGQRTTEPQQQPASPLATVPVPVPVRRIRRRASQAPAAAGCCIHGGHGQLQTARHTFCSGSLQSLLHAPGDFCQSHIIWEDKSCSVLCYDIVTASRAAQRNLFLTVSGSLSLSAALHGGRTTTARGPNIRGFPSKWCLIAHRHPLPS